MERRIHPFKHLRFLLIEHANTLGIPLGMALSAALLGLILLVVVPVGRPQLRVGQVVGLGFMETDQGSFATASVLVESRVQRIRLPTRYGCRVGDRITLRKWPLRFGYGYGVGVNPRPCSRS